MPDAKSNWMERETLNHNLGVSESTFPTEIWIALFTSDPGEGDTGFELDGGDYERKQATFDSAETVGDVTTSHNIGEIEWTNLPTSTVGWVGIYDAANGGNLRYYGPLIEERSFINGDNFKINSEQLVVRER